MSTAVIVIIVLFCLLSVGTFAYFLLTAKKYFEYEMAKKNTASAPTKKKKPVDDNSDAANYRTIAEGPKAFYYYENDVESVTAEEPEKQEKNVEEETETCAVEESEPLTDVVEETAEEVAESEQTEETNIEETAEEVASDADEDSDDADEDDSDDDADEEIVLSGEENAFAKIRVKKSFVARLTLAPETTKQYYDQIKKAVLSYKKVSSRISWAYDSINFGRTKLATLNVKGKTLYLYLALDASKYEGSKFAVDAVPTKKYAQTPCLYKIKNDRRAKYALELICDLADAFALQSGKECSDDFIPESLTVEQLIEKGLIKLND